MAPCLAAAANQCSLGAWRRHHGAAAWRNQRLRCAAGRRRGVYDIECSLCCCRRAGPWSTVEYWRAAPATAAAVLLLYVVVRLSVSEVKQGTACTAAYYSSYALTLLYYSLVLLCASSDINSGIYFVIRSAYFIILQILFLMNLNNQTFCTWKF